MPLDDNNKTSNDANVTRGQRKRSVPVLMVDGPLNGQTMETDKLPEEKWLVSRERRSVCVYSRTDELTYTFNPSRSLSATAGYDKYLGPDFAF